MEAIEATRRIRAGELIAKFYGTVQAVPSMYTLQVEQGVHVACEQGGPTFTNHSCAPNAFFDMSICTTRAPFPILTALRDIAEGEEITFNYHHTEWDMATPFVCLCGASQCIGQVRGFKHLDADSQKRYQSHLTPFIQRMWAEQEAQCAKLA